MTNKEIAEKALRTKHGKIFDLIWLAVPCPCKLCNDSKAETTFFFDCENDTDFTDRGLYCVVHGLFTKTGVIKL